MLKRYIQYFTNNPQGYWFKRKLFGWGWVPVKWQGWLVVAVALGFGYLGVWIGDSEDAPGAVVIGFTIMTLIIFGFGRWKGEKPRWQWGLPRDENN